jgi:hypothetical protein
MILETFREQQFVLLLADVAVFDCGPNGADSRRKPGTVIVSMLGMHQACVLQLHCACSVLACCFRWHSIGQDVVAKQLFGSDTLCKASVHSPNCVKVTVPSWPHGPLMCRDEIARHVDDCATNAMDDARHARHADIEKRQWKHFHFEFPNDHELSAKDICDDAGEDTDELEIEIVPITTAHLTDEGATDLRHWAAWKVARVDISPMKRGKIESSKKSKAAALPEKLHASLTTPGKED